MRWLLVEILFVVIAMMLGIELLREIYGLFAIMFATAFLLLVYSSQGFVRNRDSAPFLVWIATTFGLALAFGLFWIAMPIVVVTQELRTRHARKRHTRCAASPECNDPNCRYRS